MEAFSLIPEPSVFPNADVTSVIRDIFQNQLQKPKPSKKLSENLKKSFKSKPTGEFYGERSIDDLQQGTNLLGFAESVFSAYHEHEENLNNVTNAERDVLKNHSNYLNREYALKTKHKVVESLSLKRHPQFQDLKRENVEKYKLLQSNATLPPNYLTNVDFTLKSFKEWKKHLISVSKDSLVHGVLHRTSAKLPALDANKCARLRGESIKTNQKKSRPKKKVRESKKQEVVFSAKPESVLFTGYAPGDVLEAIIKVQNMSSSPVGFNLAPTPANSPFRAHLLKSKSKTIFPGLGFKIKVVFAPTSLDDVNEELVLNLNNGFTLVVPLIAYLEPPLLKSSEELNEYTRDIATLVSQSMVECGACLLGDTISTRVRLKSFGGCGQFCVLSYDEWLRSRITCISCENVLSTSEFSLWPAYFNLLPSEMIDLCIDYTPTEAGTSVERLVVVCDNGEARALDLLGDSLAWHHYFVSIHESLLKRSSVDDDDDETAAFLLDVGQSFPTGTLEQVIWVSNNCQLELEYRWELRNPSFSPPGDSRYSYLNLCQVHVEPDRGTLMPYSASVFRVVVVFNKAAVEHYKMILSLYIVNLPRSCFEEGKTAVRPTVVRSQGAAEQESLLYSLRVAHNSPQKDILPKSFCDNTNSLSPRASSSYHLSTTSQAQEGEETWCCLSPSPESPGLTDVGPCTLQERSQDSSWDYLDVLVDEVELLAEVVPVVLTLHPPAVDLCSPLRVDDASPKENIFVYNDSFLPLRCQWLLTNGDNGSGYKSSVAPEEEGGASVSRALSPDASSQCLDLAQISQVGSSSSTVPAVVVIVPEEFCVLSNAQVVCELFITCSKPGLVCHTVYLSVNQGDVILELTVRGTCQEPGLSISTTLLDFEVVRKGTRYYKDYTIANNSKVDKVWRLEQYKFDVRESRLGDAHSPVNEGHTQPDMGVLSHQGCYTDRYCIDARRPGLQCSLLAVQPSNQFVLVVADIKSQKLVLEAPRFENGILAPSGKMYVGLKLTQTVVLKNIRRVTSTFTWGNAFGCHCRKLKVELTPSCGEVGPLQSKCVSVTITPLDEGIVDHLYLPCFIGHTEEPIILSVVGLVKKLNVIFEILDQGNRGTVLRVPWPIRNYDPNLHLDFLHEDDILDFHCQCKAVESEAHRAFIDLEEEEEEEEQIRIDWCGEEECLQGTERDSKVGGASPCLKTVDRVSAEETADSMMEYPGMVQSLEALQLVKSEISFLATPYRTAVHRSFVIRNETPLETKFKVTLQNFPAVEVACDSDVINQARCRVWGWCKDSWANRLAEEQPLLIIADPAEGFLEPLDAVEIKLWVYGDTWGDYRDIALCEIQGLPTFYMKLQVQLVGHPVCFPMFANTTVDLPVLRFSTVRYHSDVVCRRVRVRNQSSVPVTMTWMTFLSSPKLGHEPEDPFNLCLDMFIDSEEGDASAESSEKVYIARNVSGRGSACRELCTLGPEECMAEETQVEETVVEEQQVSFGSCECVPPLTVSQLMRTERKTTQARNSTSAQSSARSRLELLLLHNYGTPDTSIFHVEPRELELAPKSDGWLSVVFNPSAYKLLLMEEKFTAVLTGCVRLRPDYSNYPGVFSRQSGRDFVSPLLHFTATVQVPLLCFEILHGDLQYYVNTNSVVHSHTQLVIVSKKFIFKNVTKAAINASLVVEPGFVFRVTRVNTVTHLFVEYNPEFHSVYIAPDSCVEVELECKVQLSHVTRAFEELKTQRRLGEERALQECLNAGEEELQYGEDEEVVVLCKPSVPLLCCVTLKETLQLRQEGLIQQSLTPELKLCFPKLRASVVEIVFDDVYVGHTGTKHVTLFNLTRYSTPFVVKPNPPVREFEVQPPRGQVPGTNYNCDAGTVLTVKFRPTIAGQHTQVLEIYCNDALLFDRLDVRLTGRGTWNVEHVKGIFEPCQMLTGTEHTYADVCTNKKL